MAQVLAAFEQVRRWRERITQWRVWSARVLTTCVQMHEAVSRREHELLAQLGELHATKAKALSAQAHELQLMAARVGSVQEQWRAVAGGALSPVGVLSASVELGESVSSAAASLALLGPCVSPALGVRVHVADVVQAVGQVGAAWDTDTSADSSTVTWDVAPGSGVRPGQRLTCTISARDHGAEARRVGGDRFEVTARVVDAKQVDRVGYAGDACSVGDAAGAHTQVVDVRDVGDGTYVAHYGVDGDRQWPAGSRISLSVMLHQRHLPGSPMTVDVEVGTLYVCAPLYVFVCVLFVCVLIYIYALLYHLKMSFLCMCTGAHLRIIHLRIIHLRILWLPMICAH